MNKINYYLLLLCSIIFCITNINLLLLVSFVFNLITFLINYKRSKDITYLLFIMINSIILPSNYLVIFINLLIYGLYLIKNHNTNKKNNLFFIVLIMYLFINTIVNLPGIVNVLFSLIFTIQLFTCSSLLDNVKNKVDFNIFDVFIKQILKCEFITTFVSIFYNYNTFMGRLDGDMITGTFGEIQGNIFAFFLIFCLLYLFRNYKKQKINWIYIIITFIILLMTTSILIIFGFVFSIIMYSIIYNRKAIRKKISLAIVIIFAGILFVLLTPSWIFRQIGNMYNSNSISESIGKINGMKYVFYDIPKDDFKFLFFGNGIGSYSSRSALVCTGEYIDFYNKLFKPSISEYTQKYIYDQLVYTKHIYNLSVKDTYYSSVISIMGEFGIIGILFLIIYFINLLRKSKSISKILTILFIFMCFVDNYLEFAKVVILLYIFIYLLRNEVEVTDE